MNLNRKTFIYSFILTVSLMAMILSYLLYLLPSLYLDNSLKSNIRRSQAFHEAYLDQGEFPIKEAPNLNGSLIFYSAKDQEGLDVISTYGTMSIHFKDPELQSLLEALKAMDPEDPSIVIDQRFLDGSFMGAIEQALKDSMDISFKAAKFKFDEKSQSSKIIRTDRYQLFISSVEDKNNLYSNGLGITNQDGTIILSYTPYSISKIDDIKDIVLGSLPLILLSLVLITALASAVFSRMIINPIQRVARHTRELRKRKLQPVQALKLDTGDEIEDLSLAIDDMYRDLQETYQNLEDQYQKQELFMRASSHQLKTPISSALLLVTSMIDGIGKYKDSQTYLPLVRQQIQSLQAMIEDLLIINRPLDKDKSDWIEISDFIQAIIKDHQIQAEDKHQDFYCVGESPLIRTNGDYLYKLLDNLIVNALGHGPDHARIDIIIQEQTIIIRNPGYLPRDLKDKLFQPFITSKNHLKAGGLGLYIAQKYAQALEYDLKLDEKDGYVEARITLT